MKFIVLSDLHLMRPGERLWGLDPMERFEHCLADIARYHGDAAFCVIAGDLCDVAAPEAYAALKTRIDRFPLKTFLLIGNHDRRDVFSGIFGQSYCDSNGFVQRAHPAGDALCLFLDTFKGGRTSAGIYCEHRRAWLRHELARAKGQPVFLFMHHPPFDIGHSLMDLIKLEEAEAFYEAIKDHDVRYLFFGHAHRPLSGVWRGIPFAAPPSVNHQLPLIAGSVPTVYSDEPAMYAVVMVEADRTIVHMDAFLDRKPAVMAVEQERGNWH
jgi:3',5'-cyclic AMP phosphodiesterase CpdA